MNDFSSEAPKSPEIEKKPLQIIYIEDQEEFRNLIENELKKFPDVELVESFSSAEKAKEYLIKKREEKGKLPDMIISDNDLGAGKTGIEFAKDLKKLEFKIPVVLFTADAKDFESFSKEELNARGLTRVVNKTIEVKDLVEILKQVKPQ